MKLKFLLYAIFVYFILVKSVYSSTNLDLITPAYEKQYGFFEFYNSKLNFVSDTEIVKWRSIGKSYASLGYYPIYSIYSSDTFSARINTSVTGLVYIAFTCVSPSGAKLYNYLVKEITSSDLGKDVLLVKEISFSEMDGYCYYYWYLLNGVDIYASRNYYFLIRESLNEYWNYKKSINIIAESDSLLDNKILTIKLDGDIEFYDHTKTIYMDNDETGNLAGTLSDVLIVDNTLTKAYPYYIRKYKGGYFEHNRNSSNVTIIDTMIPEEVTVKQLYLYYGFDYNISTSGFGNNVFDTDSWNNPFTLHQIYLDMRYNYDDFLKYFNLPSPICYKRFLEISDYDYNYDTYLSVKIPHKLTKLRIKRQLRSSSGTTWSFTYYQLDDTTKLFYTQSGLAGSITRLYNSSGDYVQLNSAVSLVVIDKFDIDISSNTLNFTNGYQTMNIYEANDYLNLTKILIDDAYITGSYHLALYTIYTRPYADIDLTIGNETNVVNEYASIDMIYNYSTNLNDFHIGGQLITNTEGTFYCLDSDNNVLDSVYIYSTDDLESYIIEIAYTLTNQTDFFNRNNFTYYCKFVSKTGSTEVTSQNSTVYFGNNKVFMSNLKPVNKAKYFDNILTFSLTTSRNINSTTNFNYSLYLYNAYCNKKINDICYNYVCHPYKQLTNGSNAYNLNYNTLIELPNEDNIYCYKWFIDFGDNVTINGNAVRYFEIDIKETPIPTYEDFIDWNQENDTEYMTAKFIENPLFYFASFLYNKFVLPLSNDTLANIMHYFFLIFWNFVFISITIFITSYRKFNNYVVSGLLTLISLFFFTQIGWIEGFIWNVMILILTFAFILSIVKGRL